MSGVVRTKKECVDWLNATNTSMWELLDCENPVKMTEHRFAIGQCLFKAFRMKANNADMPTRAVFACVQMNALKEMSGGKIIVSNATQRSLVCFVLKHSTAGRNGSLSYMWAKAEGLTLE